MSFVHVTKNKNYIVRGEIQMIILIKKKMRQLRRKPYQIKAIKTRTPDNKARNLAATKKPKSQEKLRNNRKWLQVRKN